MKNALSFFVCLLILFTCRAQADTAKIYNTSHLKKGFYKTYEDYLNNAPALIPDFTTTLLFIKNGADSMVTGARYRINDGTTVSGTWGFCDGTDVFIRSRVGLFKKRFFKLQYIGKNPFFVSWHKDIYTAGSLPAPAAADSGNAPAFYHLAFVNADGRIKKASVKNLQQLFAGYPALLKKFRIERDYSNKIKTEYLVIFNEQFIGN